MKLTRFHDWQMRFEAFVRERQDMPFVWGSNDCAHFTAACVQALTGMDLTPPDLRPYNTELQAARALKAYGGIIGIATAALGEPVPVFMARIGDVVVSASVGSDMLAVCNGSTLIAPGTSGIVVLSMDQARLCWRVG